MEQNALRTEAKSNLLRTLAGFLLCAVLSILFLYMTYRLQTPTVAFPYAIAGLAAAALFLALLPLKFVLWLIRPALVLYASMAAKVVFWVAILVVSIPIFSLMDPFAVSGYDFGLYGRLCQYQANLFFPVDYLYSYNVAITPDERESVVVSSRSLQWSQEEIIAVEGVTKPGTELGWTMSTKDHKLEILPAAAQPSKPLYYANRAFYWVLRALPAVLLLLLLVLQIRRIAYLRRVLRARAP